MAKDAFTIFRNRKDFSNTTVQKAYVNSVLFVNKDMMFSWENSSRTGTAVNAHVNKCNSPTENIFLHPVTADSPYYGPEGVHNNGSWLYTCRIMDRIQMNSDQSLLIIYRDTSNTFSTVIDKQTKAI